MSGRFIFAASLAIFAIVLLPSTAVRADEQPAPTQEELLGFFEDVALGKKQSARLTKWRYAPLVRLETMKRGPEDDEGRAVPIPIETSFARYSALAKVIAELRKLTGLPIRLLPRDIGSGGNIVITIVPRDVMPSLKFKGVERALIRKLMGPSRCFFVAWPNRSWELYKARIVINSYLEEDHVNHCFIEELTQSMGLPHDSYRLRPSIFNEGMKLRAFSDIDRAMIRTLYDPSMTVGANQFLVREIAGKVLGKNFVE